jgi:hypothetical protein
MTDEKEFWNQYLIRSYYYDGVDELEKELLEFMPGAKITRKKYLTQNSRTEYLIINNNLRIRHLEEHYNPEKRCLCVNHKILIEISPEIKHHKLIVENLERKFKLISEQQILLPLLEP